MTHVAYPRATFTAPLLLSHWLASPTNVLLKSAFESTVESPLHSRTHTPSHAFVSLSMDLSPDGDFFEAKAAVTRMGVSTNFFRRSSSSSGLRMPKIPRVRRSSERVCGRPEAGGFVAGTPQQSCQGSQVQKRLTPARHGARKLLPNSKGTTAPAPKHQAPESRKRVRPSGSSREH